MFDNISCNAWRAELYKYGRAGKLTSLIPLQIVSSYPLALENARPSF